MTQGVSGLVRASQGVSEAFPLNHRGCLSAAFWHAATRTYTCNVCPGGTYGALIGNNTSEARALAVVRCGFLFRARRIVAVCRFFPLLESQDIDFFPLWRVRHKLWRMMDNIVIKMSATPVRAP